MGNKNLLISTGRNTYMTVSPNELTYIGDGQFKVTPYDVQIMLLNKVLQAGIYGTTEPKPL